MAGIATSRQLNSILKTFSGFCNSNSIVYAAAFNSKFHSISLQNGYESKLNKLKLNDNINFKYGILGNHPPINLTLVREANIRTTGPRPDPHTEKRNLEYKILYPPNWVYSVKPLRIRRLAGRDPNTGRIIFASRSGGYTKFFLQVKNDVPAPTEPGVFYEERVLEIVRDDLRTAFLAKCCNGTALRWRVATTSMKAGDLIRTSGYIPPAAVSPKEGDTYPLGALPVGTNVCCIQRSIGSHKRRVVAAGCSVPIKGHVKGKILIQLQKKLFALFPRECLATVGQVSNTERRTTPWKNINEKRRAGFRPRSGLKQKKTGRCGRKIKPIKTVDFTVRTKRKPVIRYTLDCSYFQPDRKIIPSVNRVS